MNCDGDEIKRSISLAEHLQINDKYCEFLNLPYGSRITVQQIFRTLIKYAEDHYI